MINYCYRHLDKQMWASTVVAGDGEQYGRHVIFKVLQINFGGMYFTSFRYNDIPHYSKNFTYKLDSGTKIF
jgi:hypothetical protein